jgi:uncharacterized membrane protein (DUF373 family)
MAEQTIRRWLSSSLGKSEIVIYGLLAILLVAATLLALAGAASLIVQNLHDWRTPTQVPGVLNALLVVLLAVEILHTVRISIRSHALVIEPFLVIGLIASIRRILVISLEAAALTRDGQWSHPGAEAVFRASMIELGLVALVVLVLVFAITLLRRSPSLPDEVRDVKEPQSG